MLQYLVNYSLPVLGILSKGVQTHCDQMACSVDAREVEGYQLVHDLFLGDSTQIMGLPFQLSLFDLAVDFSHAL